MNMIFCMAGIYRRFREAGYTTPKYLLPWKGSTVLHHVLAPLLGGPVSEAVLVANRRDEAWRADIERVMAEFAIPLDRLCLVGDTRGQAETAEIGCAHLDQVARPGDRRVLFHNVDTVVEGRDLAAIAATLAGHDGWIDTLTSDSPAYSYVSVDDSGLVREMAEKRVISPHATTGLYGFGSIDRYLEAMRRSVPERAELYISDVYRTMLAEGGRIAVGLPAPGARTIILGTPAEYEAAVAGA